MNKKTILAIVLAVFWELPISVYLYFWVLSQLNPDRLIWFLFWMYVPVLIFISVLNKLVVGEKE